MRALGRAFALSAVLLAGCAKPDYLEMEPKEHAFQRVGESLWWKVVAKSKKSGVVHKVKSSWSSSDPKVATVDEVGRVKAVGPGNATITARVGELTADALVYVVAVGKVVVEPTELVLEARGDPKKITVKVFDTAGRVLTDRTPVPRCSNEEVCRANNDEVHPVDPGQTVLMVGVEGVRTEIPVTVKPGDPRKKKE